VSEANWSEMDIRWAEGVIKADFHLHSSEDPIDLIRHDAPTLIERAASAGFGALAITLHERQLDDPWIVDFARERGIVLLPGIERTIEGKHVLLINFPQAAVESVFTFRDLAWLKSRANGLVIAPHPFFPGGSCLGRQLDAHPDLFDAVEWSYFWTRQINFNSRAARWARAHGKPIVGNTDMHDIRQLGRTHSLVRAEAHADAICAAVRDGHVEVSTEPVPVVELATVLGGMAVRQAVLRNASQPVFGGRTPRTAESAGSRDFTWRRSLGL
jgi:predicted metal-dependent phosphoesterase TrpH